MCLETQQRGAGEERLLQARPGHPGIDIKHIAKAYSEKAV